MPTQHPTYIVLGAGVIGLTTALELHSSFPSSKIIITATHFPGDRSPDYCSPWAGANWMSAATDNGPQEEWDAVTFRKFAQLADEKPQAGIARMKIKALFDREIEQAGVLSIGTDKIWYGELVGGLRPVREADLQGAKFGFEFDTFMVDSQIYLPWLQGQVHQAGIEMDRGRYDSISQIFDKFSSANALFNCSGLGSLKLGGVSDPLLYPTRGQTILVESPKVPLNQMYFRSPQRTNLDTTYVFPRGATRGVVLGGCRMDNDWSTVPDMDFAEDIKRRCVHLCPELGCAEDLKVISHGVGLRPSRKGGARVEKEVIDGKVVVHNYGAGGTGYQSSWGMAQAAVDLIKRHSSL